MHLQVTNLKSGVSTTLDLDWGYYVSSPGGSTWWMNGTNLTELKSSQASGAYLFRPVNQTTAPVGEGAKPTIEVVEGPLTTEVRQSFSNYATHVIRLTKGKPYVEVEWTAGPIPGERILGLGLKSTISDLLPSYIAPAHAVRCAA